jgi:hypothetical protein
MMLITNHDSKTNRSRLLPNGDYAVFLGSSVPTASRLSAYPNVPKTRMTLLERIGDSRRRGCKGPGDRIYGTLSTIGKNDVERLHFAKWIDYEKVTTQALYTEFSRFYLQKLRDARVLQHCVPESCVPGAKLHGLPTWVVDWSINPNTARVLNIFKYDNYRAGGTSALLVYHQEGSRQLEISGVIIDTVKILSPTPIAVPGVLSGICQLDVPKLVMSESRIETGVLKNYVSVYMYSKQKDINLEGKWLKLAEAIIWQKRYATGEPIEAAYWRTLMADIDPYRMFPPCMGEMVSWLSTWAIGLWAVEESKSQVLAQTDEQQHNEIAKLSLWSQGKAYLWSCIPKSMVPGHNHFSAFSDLAMRANGRSDRRDSKIVCDRHRPYWIGYS